MDWLAERANELKHQSDASKKLVIHLETISTPLSRVEQDQ
jgi:hypothetical protein